ncbi:MAG: hypothetical protein ACXW3Z_03770 [Limisphaerales bacterium]
MNDPESSNYISIKRYQPETIEYQMRITAKGGRISEASIDAVDEFVQECKKMHIWDRQVQAVR